MPQLGDEHGIVDMERTCSETDDIGVPSPNSTPGNYVVEARSDSATGCAASYHDLGANVILGTHGLVLHSEHSIPVVETEIIYGVEATRYADNTFSGEVIVELELEKADGTVFASDSVKLRVAPFLLSDSTRPLETVYVSNADPEFVAQLKSAVGANKVVEVSAAIYGEWESGIWHPDVWLQDEVEIGYSQFPGNKAIPTAWDLPRNRGLDVTDFTLTVSRGQIKAV